MPRILAHVPSGAPRRRWIYQPPDRRPRHDHALAHVWDDREDPLVDEAADRLRRRAQDVRRLAHAVDKWLWVGQSADVGGERACWTALATTVSITASAVFDADVFDDLFKDGVSTNAEGDVVGQSSGSSSIALVPVSESLTAFKAQSAGTALLAAAMGAPTLQAPRQ